MLRMFSQFALVIPELYRSSSIHIDADLWDFASKMTDFSSLHTSKCDMSLTKAERIIFLIDVHEEMAEPWGNTNMSRMTAIKAALTNFMRRKSNPGVFKHQFALATFRASCEVRLLQPFTRSHEAMEEAMKSLEPEISDKINRSSSNSSSSSIGRSGSVDVTAVLAQLGSLLGLDAAAGSDEDLVLGSRDNFGFVTGCRSTSEARNANSTSSGSGSGSGSSNSNSSAGSSGGSTGVSCTSGLPRTQNGPADHIVRCILVYGRSREKPTVGGSPAAPAAAAATATAGAVGDADAATAMGDRDVAVPMQGDAPVPTIGTAAVPTSAGAFIPLLHHPWCYLDILYVHLRANEEGVFCQQVFDALCSVHSACPPPPFTTNNGQIVPRDGAPLVLETHASSIKLASHIALLLAHPAQRESQEGLEGKLDITAGTFRAIRHSLGREQAAAELVGEEAESGTGTSGGGEKVLPLQPI